MSIAPRITLKWMLYRALAKRTLQRRAEDIHRLVAERKKGKIAYFIMEKLVVKDEPLDSRPRDGSDSEENEILSTLVDVAEGSRMNSQTENLGIDPILFVVFLRFIIAFTTRSFISILLKVMM